MSIFNRSQPTTTSQSALSSELKEILEFTQKENQKHRDYFENLYKITAGAMTILFVVIGGVVVFFGWNTIDNIKKQAQAATDTEIQATRERSRATLAEQTSTIQSQITAKLNAEFASDAIKQTIGEAARQQTAGALRPIITSEVKAQVSTGVRAEQGNVRQALLREVHSSVEELKPTINDRVDKTVQNAVTASVTSKVDSQIAPRLSQLENTTQISNLINRAQAGEGPAFDFLVTIATTPQSDPQTSTLAMQVVRAILQSHSVMLANREFSDPKTTEQKAALLDNADSFTRQAAIDGLDNAYWKEHLDQLYKLMTSDSSLNIRADAYFKFSAVTGFKADPLDNYRANKWWNEHRKDLVK